MPVWMMRQGLAPGGQDRDDADLGAEPAGLAASVVIASADAETGSLKIAALFWNAMAPTACHDPKIIELS